MNSDIELVEKVTIKANEDIKLYASEKVTIYPRDIVTFLQINVGGTLTVENIVFDGSNNSTTEYSKSSIYVYGTFNLINSKIQKFSTMNSAIYVSSGSLIMDSESELTENKNISFGDSGGAVETKGECLIKGGTISNNYGEYSGGGIIASGNVTIDGTVIKNNTTKYSGRSCRFTDRSIYIRIYGSDTSGKE